MSLYIFPIFVCPFNISYIFSFCIRFDAISLLMYFLQNLIIYSQERLKKLFYCYSLGNNCDFHDTLKRHQGPPVLPNFPLRTAYLLPANLSPDMTTGEQLLQSLTNLGRTGIFLERQVIRAGERGIILNPVQIQRPRGGGRQTSSGSKQGRLVGREEN